MRRKENPDPEHRGESPENKPSNGCSLLHEKVELYRYVTEKHNLTTPYIKTGIRNIYLYPPSDVRKYWARYLEAGRNHYLSLYVHVPFCRKTKCRYCMYRSKILGAEYELDNYLCYIEEEAKFYASVFERQIFRTVHVGGGTPTLLDENRLSRLLTAVNRCFSLAPERTFTLEIKPSNTTEAQLETAAAHGCNRISIGVQSLNRETLELAHREYAEICRLQELVDFIHARRFREINVDLIVGLPGDSPKSFRESFQQVAGLGVSTITLYFFRLENSSYNKKMKSKYADRSKSGYAKEFLDALEGVSAVCGYTNITKNPHFGYQVFVNNDYHDKLESHPTEWHPEKRNSLLGLGIGARSFILNVVSFDNMGPHGLAIDKISDAFGLKPEFYLTKYMTLVTSEIERMRDYVLKMFHSIGRVSLWEFKTIFNKDIHEVFGLEIESLACLGKLAAGNDHIVMLCEGFERAVCLKFFYDQDQILKLAEKEPEESFLTF